MDKIARAVAFVNKIFMSAAMVLVAFSTILTVINAILRKIPTMGGFPWSEELSTYSVIMMLFLGMAYLEQHDQHLCIDILTTAVKSEKAKKMIRILRGVVTIFIMCVLVRWGVALVQSQIKSHITTYLLRMPRAIFFGAMVGGFVMVAVVWAVILICRKGGPFDVD